MRCLPPEGSHLRDTARGLSSLHRPLRALSKSPTPKRVGRVCPVGHATAPTPSHPHRQRRVARTAPSDTHAARPPFHPRSTVAVAAGAHDGSQQLHATLTPLQGLQDQCRAEARQGVVGVLSDCAAPPSPAMRTALSDLVAAVTEYRVTRCGATLLSTRDTRPQPRQKFTCSIEGVRVN